ncbi:hypothetical protein BsWGS_00639 [Bradybaena similaris]
MCFFTVRLDTAAVSNTRPVKYNTNKDKSDFVASHFNFHANRSPMMTPAAGAIISGYICLSLVVYGGNAVVDKTEGSCTTYTAKLISVPDLTRRIVYQARRHDVNRIVGVQNTDYQRSFYWCQLEVLESDNVVRRYRHFGFNASHWWVEKGCGGWFIVTECKADGLVVGHGDIGLLDNAKMASVISSTLGIQLLGKNRKPLTVIDEMYKHWPSVGYTFPTTGQMWDMLNNATYVDVAAQLGFYNNQRMPLSTTEFN